MLFLKKPATVGGGTRTHGELPHTQLPSGAPGLIRLQQRRGLLVDSLRVNGQRHVETPIHYLHNVQTVHTPAQAREAATGPLHVPALCFGDAPYPRLLTTRARARTNPFCSAAAHGAFRAGDARNGARGCRLSCAGSHRGTPCERRRARQCAFRGGGARARARGARRGHPGVCLYTCVCE